MSRFYMLSLFNKFLLRKRLIIETVNDQLKNILQIEHSRHRSPINFIVNLIAGLVASPFARRNPPLILDFLRLFQQWFCYPYVELTLIIEALSDKA